MKKHKTYTVAYRRKREGKTDYKKRLKLLLAEKPRLVVRKSLKNVTAQIITFAEKGDKVITSVNGSELTKMGWNYSDKNVPGAYLIGLLLAKKAKENGINEVILDVGLNKSVKGSKLYAVLKGALDNGLKIPHSENVVPNEDRISGKHIEEFAKKLPEEDYNKKFSGYLKKGADPKNISKVFNDLKNKIIGA